MTMPGIIEIPSIVEQAVKEFGGVFLTEPARRHFAEYLTGLLIAERKTVSGINSEFAQTTDQSCLNRFLTESSWDEKRLNELRLEWLQKDPSTRYADSGVIPIDNTLIDHSGKQIEDVGYFWDHAEERYKIAHDYTIANYVCPSGKHYPLEFRLFRKKQNCEETREQLLAAGFSEEDARSLTQFKDHTALVKELVDWVVEKGIPGDFTFDIYFCNAPVTNYINSRDRGYVGDFKFNRNVIFMGNTLKASDLAEQIPMESRKEVIIGEKRQWYFTKTVRIPGTDHKVRIVILWQNKGDKEAKKILITNRVQWEVSRILRVYRRRWTGTETFHRDGKQQLGMGDCQLRIAEGQTRHMYLVFLTYSLLMRELRQGRASEWAHSLLTTIGEGCRAVMRETLGKTISWAIRKATVEGWTHERIRTHLALA